MEKKSPIPSSAASISPPQSPPPSIRPPQSPPPSIHRPTAWLVVLAAAEMGGDDEDLAVNDPELAHIVAALKHAGEAKKHVGEAKKRGGRKRKVPKFLPRIDISARMRRKFGCGARLKDVSESEEEGAAVPVAEVVVKGGSGERERPQIWRATEEADKGGAPSPKAAAANIEVAAMAAAPRGEVVPK